MLSYIDPAGHTKYMGCLSLYPKDMNELPVMHPEIFKNV